MRIITSIAFILFTVQLINCQYTETINSNRPGTSHGAFSIGTNVLQFELGASMYNFSHSNLNFSKINGYSADYLIRYGFFKENLEVFVAGKYNFRNVKDYFNINMEDDTNIDNDYWENFIGEQKLGFKYLVLDPYKNKKWHGENFYSWKANTKIRWVDLIPAVSVIAGADILIEKKIQYDDLFYSLKRLPQNWNFTEPYIKVIDYEDQSFISPFFGISTQHHFKGKWVLVNNFFYENIGSEYDKLNYILTVTHNLDNPTWSIFGEYQGFKNKVYSDQYLKFGIAKLMSDDLQLDLNFALSLKNTPSSVLGGIGISKRLDWHKDVTESQKKAIKDFKSLQKESKKQEKAEKKLSKKKPKKEKNKEPKVKKRDDKKKQKSLNKSIRKNKKLLKKEEKALKKLNRKSD